MRKLNINTGPPVKRFVEGVVWWSAERHFSGWRKLRRAVIRHKRWYRGFKRERKQEKRREWELWSQRREGDPQALDHSRWPG